ncbi:hypothetical protein VPH35_080548 [Triticum aestivum]|uniref:Uncharacterized protein n=1 Tax=Aegilops tauschii TaxID=37682 RepID=R7W4V5_AEGTA
MKHRAILMCATLRQYAALPCLAHRTYGHTAELRVYSLPLTPVVSLHYEVYQVYMVSKIDRMYSINALGSEEPWAMIVHSAVFSSKTKQWEMREFVPGNCTPSNLYNVEAFAHDINWPSAHYWHGSLSVACENGVLMILHCPEGTYDMVQLPGEVYRNAGKSYQLSRRSRAMRKHNSLKIEQWVTWDMVASRKAPISLFKQIDSNKEEEWNKDEDNFIEVDKGVVSQMKSSDFILTKTCSSLIFAAEQLHTTLTPRECSIYASGF